MNTIASTTRNERPVTVDQKRSFVAWGGGDRFRVKGATRGFGRAIRTGAHST
jgi:hypothetical protein